MANYYTNFCTVLPRPELIILEEYDEKVTQFLSHWQDLSEQAEEDDIEEFFQYFSGIETTYFDHSLYLQDDGEGGSTEAAIHFIQEYLAYFDFKPGQGVQFDWACTCSKPMPGAFYGGSVVITRDQTIFQVPEDIRKLAVAKGIQLITEF